MEHLLRATGRVPGAYRCLWVPGASGCRVPIGARCLPLQRGTGQTDTHTRLHPGGLVRSAVSLCGGETEARKGPPIAFIPFQTYAAPSRTFNPPPPTSLRLFLALGEGTPEL